MPSSLRKSLLSYLFLLLGGLLALGAEGIQHFLSGDPGKEVAHAESVFRSLEKKMEEGIGKIASVSTENELHDYFMHSGWEKDGLSFYILRNDSLVRWSDNEPLLKEKGLDTLRDQSLLQLPNGLFYAGVKNTASGKVVGLLLVRHGYAYENTYLKNEFNPALGLPTGMEISSTGIPFHAPSGQLVFTLNPGPSRVTTTPGTWLYMFAGLAFLPGIFLLTLQLLRRNRWTGVLFLVAVFAIRLLMIGFKIPEEFYATDLFSPQNYASSFFFNSLGDLLINTLLLLGVAVLVYRLNRPVPASPRPSGGRIAAVLALITILAAGIHGVVRGLVINSRISFNVNNLSGLGGYTLVAFFCIAGLLLGFFLIVVSFLEALKKRKIRSREVMVLLFLSSAYVSVSLWVLNAKKEEESRKLFAQKIDARQDHIAEYLFDEAARKLVGDSSVRTALLNGPAAGEQLRTILSRDYFNGYLAKFELSISAFDSTDQPFDSLSATLSSYLQQTTSQGKPTSSEHLYYLPNESGRLSYLAVLPVRQSSGEKCGTLVVQLNAKFVQSEEGFPELFISKKFKENTSLSDYSFARYSYGALIYEYGNYAYSFNDKEFAGATAESSFLDINGYNHLVYRVSPTALIVVSRPSENSFYLLTLFSWVFAFFSLVLVLAVAIYRVSAVRKRITLTLTSRIQVSVIVLVVLSFILIGTGTVVYIFRKYDEDQKRSISEQVNGLWFLLGNNVGAGERFSARSAEEAMPQLNDLVSNLNIDFNIFDEGGHLFYSSQPKIFEQNIVSDRMNPEAFFELQQEGRTQYIHPERIGQLKFVAAYAPFTDANGAITGYLNLPYFEKQNELNKEISGFLSALINIYVLLLALALLVTLFISSRITKPLLLIQEKIAGIRFGKRNEQILYSREDEIGQLVKEYNRMVEELTVSAEKLARSERESAWREMAKQVAHEIKNPLTPMKLSVQHLQMAWKENRPGKEELLDRMAQTLIQQIDTLSAIASEFSNFAMMPPAKREDLDLRTILDSTVALFSESREAELHYRKPQFPCTVNADKDQLLRVFSNLFKNAIQSIPESRKGIVSVEILKEPGGFTVLVADNGVGIPDDQREKIFRPNFTTKSSGMGLGLAMVKSIVENSGGQIWFSSKKDEGTTFYVSLPFA